MAITLSLFVRRTCITFSQVVLNVPSIPLTSIAFTSILVKRNGTYTTFQTGKILSNKNAMAKSQLGVQAMNTFLNVGHVSKKARIYFDH